MRIACWIKYGYWQKIDNSDVHFYQIIFVKLASVIEKKSYRQTILNVQIIGKYVPYKCN